MCHRLCSAGMRAHRPYVGPIPTVTEIEMSADVGEESTVIGDYNFGIVCYSLTNPVSI